MGRKGQLLDPLSATKQPDALPARSLRRLLAAACVGAVASPIAALAVCGGRWDSRRALFTAVLGMTWAAGWLLIAGRPWPPELYIPALLAWNALASAGLERLAPPAMPRHGAARGLDPATIALTAGLAYAAAAAMAAMVSVLLRLAQFQATSLFGPEALAWALLALPVGAALGAYWSRMAGPASGRVAVSALAAAPLIYLGSGLLGIIVMVSAASWGFPWTILHEPRYDLWAWLSAIPSILVFAACAAWSGSAPTVPRVLLRVVFSVLICAAFMANAAIWQGLHAGWHMRVASGLILDPDSAGRWRAIERLRTALAVRPRAHDHAFGLWSCAAEAAAMGRDRQAEEWFAAAAALPEEHRGQEYVLRARVMLQAHKAPLPGAATEVPAPLAVEGTPYLDSDWRAVVGLWRAALSKERTTESLANLQKLSSSDKRIRLPRLDNWSSLAAYSSLYGAPVSVAPSDPARVRRLLDSGKPVLVRHGWGYRLIVGHDPAWRSFRFLEYGEEQPWLTAELSRAEAAGAVEDDETLRLRRLARLQRMVSDTMPETELARALSDSQGLCAWPDQAEKRPGPALQSWLLGEAALESGDPVAALSRYEDARRQGAGDWLLPYVRAAALSAEREHTGIEERHLPTDPVVAAFAQWRRGAGREAWLARAAAAPAADLPSPVLWRLTRVLERRDPSEFPLLADCYAGLAERFPEAPWALGGLSEMRRLAGDMAGWRSAALRLAASNPRDSDPLLDAVEASLALSDAERAARILDLANPFDSRVRGRRLGLAGRLELARGRTARACRLLRAAARADRTDPAIHRDLARALDALGRRDEARRHWLWVSRTGLETADLEAARRRLLEGG